MHRTIVILQKVMILFTRLLLCFESFTYFHFYMCRQIYGIHQYSALLEVIEGMGQSGSIYKPNKSIAAYHGRKYKVFLEMLKDQEKYNQIMS